jgi:hypothetical protein
VRHFTVINGTKVPEDKGMLTRLQTALKIEVLNHISKEERYVT